MRSNWRSLARLPWRLICLPFIVVYIVWWDFRCHWVGWHNYRPVWRLTWRDSGVAPAYWRYYERCSQCGSLNLNKRERLFRWRPEMGDGPYPLGPDGKEMVIPDAEE